jgi:hypothetical protein
MQVELASLSPHSEQIIAGRSVYSIQFQQPELVIEGIRALVEQTEGSALGRMPAQNSILAGQFHQGLQAQSNKGQHLLENWVPLCVSFCVMRISDELKDKPAPIAGMEAPLVDKRGCGLVEKELPMLRHVAQLQLAQLRRHRGPVDAGFLSQLPQRGGFRSLARLQGALDQLRPSQGWRNARICGCWSRWRRSTGQTFWM